MPKFFVGLHTTKRSWLPSTQLNSLKCLESHFVYPLRITIVCAKYEMQLVKILTGTYSMTSLINIYVQLNNVVGTAENPQPFLKFSIQIIIARYYMLHFFTTV